MKKITGYIIMAVVLGTITIAGGWWSRQYFLQHRLAEKVLRFHVLANSDSVEDQNLKLRVRDAIGGYMQEKMQNQKSKAECEGFISENTSELEQLAKCVIENAGFSYEVHAELAECTFPAKTYGTYTFPAGKYDALRVTIGDGKGQNWWCVMYPNMCFENSMYEVVDKKSEEKLRAVLDDEEYQMVLESGNYELRFWFLELFK